MVHPACWSNGSSTLWNWITLASSSFFQPYCVPPPKLVFLLYLNFNTPPPQATGLGLVCFVVINPTNRVDLGFFLFHKFSNFTPPPPGYGLRLNARNRQLQRHPRCKNPPSLTRHVSSTGFEGPWCLPRFFCKSHLKLGWKDPAAEPLITD